eukprot:scaffold43502_cov92-Phaeocystis_antarctica.AAC.1
MQRLEHCVVPHEKSAVLYPRADSCKHINKYPRRPAGNTKHAGPHASMKIYFILSSCTAGYAL